jgi:S1-C subfamily serine protease
MFEDFDDSFSDQNFQDTKYYMRSIIKIYSHDTTPDFATPWQLHKPVLSTSSGFIIDCNGERRILCNSHGVTHSSMVSVRKHGDTRKYHAKVAHIANECDLAILSVDDECFWRGLEPLEFGSLPELQEKVMVLGYPTGGDAICVTEGVVSRVDVFEYAHSQSHLLTVQIDASINGGNSGGPALCDGRVVGVAFQSLEDADNIGYIIPVPVVQHFLDDIARGGYKGFPMLNIKLQLAENETLRQYKRIPPLSALLQLLHPRATSQLRDEVHAASEQALAARAAAKPANANANAKAQPPTAPTYSVLALSEHVVRTVSDEEAAKAAADACLGAVAEETAAAARATATKASETKSSCALESASTSMTDDAPSPATPTASASASVSASVSTSLPTVQTPHGPMVPALLSGELYYIQPDLFTPDTSSTSTTSSALPAPLRRYLQHPDSADAALGVIVASVPKHSPSEGCIRAGDVLLTFNDTPLGSNNTVVLRGRERVSMLHLISMCRVGDTPEVLLLRERKYIMRVRPRVQPQQRLCPLHEWSMRPAYLVALGMVLLPLTGSFLEASYGGHWTEKAPVGMVSLVNGGVEFTWADEEVILLAHVLTSEHTRGYEDREMQRLKAVNGVKVRNLKHASELLAAAASAAEALEAAGQCARGDTRLWLRLEVAHGDEIVLDLRKAKQKHIEILTRHQVPLPGAFKVQPMWSDVEVPKVVRKHDGDSSNDAESKKPKISG